MLSGKFIIFFILCKLKKEDRHTLEILLIKLSLLSKIKQRFLTEFVGKNVFINNYKREIIMRGFRHIKH